MRGKMVARRALLALAVTLGPIAPAAADDFLARNSMSRDDILAAFVDRQLSGVYPSGTPWSELIRSDGSTDYREGGARRDGRWWFRSNDFCFRYDVPLSGGCFRVVRIGANCYELYAVNPGEENSLGPREGASWNGRLWRDDTAHTCDERPTS